ncbi:hypothetical protein [Ekhidna sp.]|uniref:hypothetical protein n=1 Tax=Ekhidna sp. TaxID=2608089 RepID=UPI003B50C1BB
MAKNNVRKIGKKMKSSQAKKWVKRYQKENPDAEVNGWLFGDDIIEAILKYKGCEGIWFFKGINDNGEEKLVMYPADADGNILASGENDDASKMALLNDGGIEPANESRMCPPMCPKEL